MPGLSGQELTGEIRRFNTSTPILFYSGAAYDSDKQKDRDAGAHGYLTKPLGISALVDEVAKLIAEARIAFRLLLIYLSRSLSSIRNVRNGKYTLRLYWH